ncbi:MAG: flagellar hook assembly protein FlgD [Pseudomonadota bacterium]
MSSIESNKNVYDSLGLSQQPKSKQQGGDELGQDAFMELMLTQLKNQNPLEPMENGDFLAQMAQFSSASGIGELKDAFDDFATGFNSSQALQASSLVGREVILQSGKAQLSASGGVAATADLPVSTTAMHVTVSDPAGQVVRTMNFGQQGAGEVDISWDGMTDSGVRAVPGDYVIRAEAAIDGEMQSLDTSVAAAVESVTLGQGGRDVTLNVAGQGDVPMSSIRKIM